MTIYSQSGLFIPTTRIKVCFDPNNPSSHSEAMQERIAKCIPLNLPFPRERLQGEQLCHMSGRDQIIDFNGSFVLTDIKKLPSGGQSQRVHTDQNTLTAIILGDMGAVSDEREAIFAQVGQLCEADTDKNLIFGLGDWLYPYGPINLSNAEIARVQNQILNAFTGISKDTAKFGVLGNHEYGISNTAADPEAFLTLARTANIQFPGRYYTLEITSGDWVVDCFALDSTTLACDPTQVSWFQEQVALSKSKEAGSNEKRWRIVMAHHPLISYGLHHGETTYFIDLMGASLKDIDLYCCGHEHDLEYILPADGLPAIVLSGTSSDTRIFNTESDADYISNEPGFASVTISKSALDIQFYKGASMSVLHQHSIIRP